MVATMRTRRMVNRIGGLRVHASERKPIVTETLAQPEPTPPQITLEALCEQWRIAFDAADSALRAARDLPADELGRRARQLATERATTLDLLRAAARAHGVNGHYLHLTPRRDAKRLLGLPADLEACVFNLDGVLIESATLHAAAWQRTFDEFIWERIERTKGQFAPFDPRADYARYLHGRPRSEGVRAFLASRGISLAEGASDDRPGLETVHGLANRKNEVLRRRIEEGGVSAYEGSLTYLRTVLDAGVHTAVVSASANTARILERAGLAPFIERSVDGNAMIANRLRAKPEPDTLLRACDELGVAPDHAAAFETTRAGVEAARAARFAVVIGIDQFGQEAALRAAGAVPVVAGLAEILDERLAA